MPRCEKRCHFCGRKNIRVEVGHLDGHEENEAPDNLTWTCRPCNVDAGNSLRNASMGRKTHQFNPTRGGGAKNLGEWMQAVGAITPHVDRGDRGLVSTMSVSEAVDMIRSTPHARRSSFARDLRRFKRNPSLFGPGGIFGSRDYAYDIGAAREAAAEARRAKPVPKGRYRGFKLYRTPDGEYYSSLDSDSWYDSLRSVKAAIDSYKKGRNENPGVSADQARWIKFVLSNDENSTDAELVRLFESNGVSESAARKWVARRDYYLRHPARNPAKFDQCVKDVEAKGGAANAYAVCLKRRGKRNIVPLGLVDLASIQQTEEGIRRLALGKGHRAKSSRRNPRNPEAGALEMYEKFHGRPASELTKITETVHYHEYLAECGALELIEVKAPNRDTVTLDNFGGTLVCSNEEGSQLYFLGGDQSVDTGAFGIEGPIIADFVDLGEVRQLIYYTVKDHLGKDGGEANYYHHLGEEDKAAGRKPRLPRLAYSVRDKRLLVYGGAYMVEPEGIRN